MTQPAQWIVAGIDGTGIIEVRKVRGYNQEDAVSRFVAHYADVYATCPEFWINENTVSAVPAHIINNACFVIK